MAQDFKLLLYSISQLLIQKVFKFKYVDVSYNKKDKIAQSERQDICWYCYTLQHDVTVLKVYMGYSKNAHTAFMDIAYDGLKQIENEIDKELLYTNIAGLIIFKLHDILRYSHEKFQYSLHENMKSIPINSIDTLFLGEKETETIFLLGYQTM